MSGFSSSSCYGGTFTLFGSCWAEGSRFGIERRLSFHVVRMLHDVVEARRVISREGQELGVRKHRLEHLWVLGSDRSPCVSEFGSDLRF
jgi:hypothetical protein